MQQTVQRFVREDRYDQHEQGEQRDPVQDILSGLARNEMMAMPAALGGGSHQRDEEGGDIKPAIIDEPRQMHVS